MENYNLRYPIGEFKKPQVITKKVIANYGPNSVTVNRYPLRLP